MSDDSWYAADKEGRCLWCGGVECSRCRDRSPKCIEVPKTPDPVNHPTHYTNHPSGVECIQITEHMGFNLGNALKYIWRADLKEKAVEDMRKAIFYLNREIALREK